MKKVVCLLLSLCLCAALCVPALADTFKEDFQEELTEDEIREKIPKYFSWIRNGSVDELHSPFNLGKIEGYLDYSYISRDTSWTITHTGGDDYKIFLYVAVLDAENHQYYSDTTYSLCEDGVFRSMGEDDDMSTIKVLHSGDSATFSFEQFIARETAVEAGHEGRILDTGDGKYVYCVTVHLAEHAPGEYEPIDESGVTEDGEVYAVDYDYGVWVYWMNYFMWNEAEAQRIQAELSGGQASTSPNPAPDNAELKPDNATPEANSPEPQASGKQFADVSNTAYYYDAVYWALRQNITEGVTDTAFSPNDACTRAQILTFIWRYAGKQEPSVSNPFNDVSADNYYYKAALWAYEKGMVSGTAFNGDAPCTRAAAVTYLWILAGRPDTPIAGDTMFADIGSMEHPEAAAYAMKAGITKGTTETTFSPDRICTRAHIVTFLNRYEQQFNGV